MGVKVRLRLPYYDDAKGQVFPHRTLSMLISLGSTLASSALVRRLFIGGHIPEKMDVFRCFFREESVREASVQSVVPGGAPENEQLPEDKVPTAATDKNAAKKSAARTAAKIDKEEGQEPKYLQDLQNLENSRTSTATEQIPEDSGTHGTKTLQTDSDAKEEKQHQSKASKASRTSKTSRKSTKSSKQAPSDGNAPKTVKEDQESKPPKQDTGAT